MEGDKLNVDIIFDYVVNKKYPSGASKNEKANLTLSKKYVARSGQLYYKHNFERNSQNVYREILVVRDVQEQQRIIENVHMGSGDSATARCMED